MDFRKYAYLKSYVKKFKEACQDDTLTSQDLFKFLWSYDIKPSYYDEDKNGKRTIPVFQRDELEGIIQTARNITIYKQKKAKEDAEKRAKENMFKELSKNSPDKIKYGRPADEDYKSDYDETDPESMRNYYDYMANVSEKINFNDEKDELLYENTFGKKIYVTEKQLNYIKESKKVIKNDEGEIVPEICPKCGSRVGTYIQGEPIYRCSNDNCKEYFGTVKFSLKEGKSIFITESQLNEIKENNYVTPKKVKIVEKYLNNGFKRGSIHGLSEDGYPKAVAVIGMIGTNGEVIKNMTPKQMLELLSDKFGKIYSDKDRRESFLKQVLIDWFNKKITKDGMLTKNIF